MLNRRTEHRPDLEPNGKIVRCVEDKGNGYLVVTSDGKNRTKHWLINEKYLTEIIY